MLLSDFIRQVIAAKCSDKEAAAYLGLLGKSEKSVKKNSDEIERNREELLNAILDCVMDVAKPSSIIATELNISSQKAQAYCGILEREDLVIVTIGESPVNSKRNVKYFKKA